MRKTYRAIKYWLQDYNRGKVIALSATVVACSTMIWHNNWVMYQDLKQSHDRAVVLYNSIESRRAGAVESPNSEDASMEAKPVSSGEQTTDTPRESRTVTMTGYTSHAEQTDSSPCISADNTNICEYDGCVVASNDYPLGTEIEVEGFGRCTVKDRMATRFTGVGAMDMYFGMDIDRALQFGKREVSISIVS